MGISVLFLGNVTIIKMGLVENGEGWYNKELIK
jgi:hypothetical protein